MLKIMVSFLMSRHKHGVKEMWLRYGRKGRGLVLTEFSLDRVNAETLVLYEELQ
jgi:hypothetical protein